MRNKCEANHVLYRDGIYYYVRHVPYDLTSYYDVKRLCFSLKTKSASAAARASKSINQRLEDYWLGLRLQNMDIPAIQVVRTSDEANAATLRLSEACELYLRLRRRAVMPARSSGPGVEPVADHPRARSYRPDQEASPGLQPTRVGTHQMPFRTASYAAAHP